MKLTLHYENMTFEAEYSTVEEKNDLVKLVKYTINDLNINSINDSLKHYNNNKNDNLDEVVESYEEEPDLATEKQLDFLRKFHVKDEDIPANLTKNEAANWINELRQEYYRNKNAKENVVKRSIKK